MIKKGILKKLAAFNRGNVSLKILPALHTKQMPNTRFPLTTMTWDKNAVDNITSLQV